MNAHVFRVNDATHVVISPRNRIPRNGQHQALCAQVIGQDAQRIVPHSDPARSAPITCDACLRSFVAFVDQADSE